MRRIDDRERRARLAVRHHLAPEALAESPLDVARDLVGIHATDPASVYLGALARARGLEIGAVERALYEERSLLRIVGMRRTMFVVPVELAGIVNAACGRAIGVAERRRVLGMLRAAGIAADPEAWLADVEAATLRALDELGEATASAGRRRRAGNPAGYARGGIAQVRRSGGWQARNPCRGVAPPARTALWTPRAHV